MKKTIFILAFFIVMGSCSKHVKNYYADGKLEIEYTVDHDGKKNGLCKIYDKEGKWYREITMIHDTMSGLMKYYYKKSGNLKKILLFKRGVYNIPLTDSDFTFSISHYSFTQSYSYKESGDLSSYVITQVVGKNKTIGLGVLYQNDSIVSIVGRPLTSTITVHDDTSHIKMLKISISYIPKCSSNLYVSDSTDKIAATCVGCDNINAKIDITKSYTLRVEYIDSAFHVKHSIDEPFLKWDKGKFPDGKQTSHWNRE